MADSVLQECDLFISNLYYITNGGYMTIKEYQEYVRNGASDKYDNKLALLGLMGEVGELSDIVKK